MSQDDFNTLATSYLIHATAPPPAPTPQEALISQPAETVSPARPISTHAEVVQLKSDADWDSFHHSYTAGRQGNFKPWLRCLSLLRSKEGAIRSFENLQNPHFRVKTRFDEIKSHFPNLPLRAINFLILFSRAGGCRKVSHKLAPQPDIEH